MTRRGTIAILLLAGFLALPSAAEACHGQNDGKAPADAQEPLGTPGSIFRAWMHSQGHRENILGDYEDTGIGLRTGKLEGYGGAHVWTEEFGSRSC